MRWLGIERGSERTSLKFPLPVLTCRCSAGGVTVLVEEEGAASALGLNGTAGARRGRREDDERVIVGVETFGDTGVDDAIKEALCILDTVVARAQHPGAVATVRTRILSATKILCTRKRKFGQRRSGREVGVLCERSLGSYERLVSFASCEPSAAEPSHFYHFLLHQLLRRRFFLCESTRLSSPRKGARERSTLEQHAESVPNGSKERNWNQR